MKVHKVTILIVDHDDLGAEGVQLELENTEYANHCMRPRVDAIETCEVAWSGDHPLNMTRTWRTEFRRLFPSSPLPES